MSVLSHVWKLKTTTTKDDLKLEEGLSGRGEVEEGERGSGKRRAAGHDQHTLYACMKVQQNSSIYMIMCVNNYNTKF